MVNKKIPMRQCLALNESFPKSELIRIVRTPDGKVLIDLKGKVNGRGAYLSKNKKAVEVARKKKVLDKKLEVVVPEEIYEQLLEIIGE